MAFFTKLKKVISGNLLVLICPCVSVLMENAIKGLFLCTCFPLGLLGMIHNHRNAEIQSQKGQRLHEMTKCIPCQWRHI